MISTPKSDEDLVTQVLPSLTPDPGMRDGGWSECEAAYGERLEAFILIQIQLLQDVEDIYQDTFAAAYQQVEAGKFQYTGTPLIAYLYAIARNKIKAYWRRQKATEPLNSEIYNSNILREPELRVEIHEMLGELSGSIEELSADQQYVVRGFLEGKSYTELAQDLDTSEVNVRQLQRRAILKLRERMGSQESKE